MQQTKALAASLPSLGIELEASLKTSKAILELLNSDAFTQTLAGVIQDNQSTLLLEANDIRRRDDLLAWLTQIDPSSYYQAALDKHLAGTGVWLLNDSHFQEWRSGPGSILWIHGISGSGKTKLISNLISTQINHFHQMIYYYFDFNDVKTLSITSLLCSCISHLVRRLPYKEIPVDVTQLFSEQTSNREPWADQVPELVMALESALSLYPSVLIAVDAIDTTEWDIGSYTIELLAKLTASGKVHVAVTGTPSNYMLGPLEACASTKIAVDGLSHEKDIAYYIDQRLASSNLHKWPLTAKDSIRKGLMSSAGTLFRWVALSIDALEGCLTLPVLKRTLDNLPHDLFGMYRRTLTTIDADCVHLAKRALFWLMCSGFSLTVEALAEIMSIGGDES
ncbi:hypothetical protein AAFC00_006193 [Neodothiora populina]|uniref:Nephrocystin 3-like N-terminal domain-containing protein n=1 Tax=Neodothiora populina TaxID=2781224 RepID=A0ABR3P4L9_9PEZI